MLKKVELNGRITLLVGREGANLTIKDENSNIDVLEIQLSPQDFMRLLGREAYLPCKIRYGQLDRVGKQMQMRSHTFEMPDTSYNKMEEVAAQLAVKTCPEGWTPDLYFG